MNTQEIARTLATLFGELVDGAPASGGYMLNAGDAGMLRSLDTLPATAASTLTPTGSSIAAHVDHVRYGLSLMNRWSAGDNRASRDKHERTDWKRASWSGKQPSHTDRGVAPAYEADLPVPSYKSPRLQRIGHLSGARAGRRTIEGRVDAG
jgi:hypothetical protein